ncbi:MAG: O-antigen ligase family protein [Ignavibacteria bacterium]|jgi:O-antigen ligase|nr:O-antigen ligase family protein [Ignavibacteria bacterium]MCU7502358.1 O-antigen ligase family protein [Ignavibacteria bacterium]MCU7515077.1 O-antigen ligase family protein [Ignavibacteria bacterium]
MTDLYLIFSILITSTIALGIVYLCIVRFETALFLVIVSPWISAVFFNNLPSFDYQAEGGPGSYLRIGILALTGIAGIVKYLRLLPVNKGRMPVHFLLLGLFLVFALLSVSYSIDKEFTFIRTASFFALGGFLLGFDSWLKEEEQFEKALNVIFFFVAISVIINSLALVLLPSRVWWWEAEERFLGLWDHPNTLGGFCMLSYPVLLWKLGRSENLNTRLILVALLLLTVSMHYLSGSRTSIVVAVAGLITWFLVQKKVLKAGLTAALFILLAVIFVQFKPQVFEREGDRKLTDLTGREEFWQGAGILISERPLQGYGYSVEGKVWEDARFYDPKNSLWAGSSRSSLHNGYISVAIGVGLLAFVLWCIILLIPLWRVSFTPASDYKALIISMIIMILLSNFAESAITGGNSINSVFFWIAWVLAGRAAILRPNDLVQTPYLIGE